MSGPTPNDWRVILRDHATAARVEANGEARDAVPIVTAKVAGAEAVVMDGLTHDAVLLTEKSDAAHVRVGMTWRAGVPIFKERAREDDAARTELVRVRVHEIRERGAVTPTAWAAPEAEPEKKSRFGG
ncbi:MAG: hypothetical protein ACYDCK_08515, partial [Thermoplasmatota archaeon]